MEEVHMSARELEQLLPQRDRWAHKGDFGRVLILSGSVGYTGAPKLAANAALHCGSGLIFVGVPEPVYPIVASGLTEPMVFPLPSRDGMLAEEAAEPVLERMRSCDACLLGPGLGQSESVRAFVFRILREANIPLVLDADGINALDGHIDVLRETACPVILTPHDGEFARLGGELSGDRLAVTQEMAKRVGQILLRKGHQTICCDAHRYYVNQTGNPGMATGGSGVGLGGVIVSLLGQKVEPFAAAAAGAWLHGAAGDICARELGEYGMTPSDLIPAISRLLK